MAVHLDNTAMRAVDACGGTYTEAEQASGYSIGHSAALASAIEAVVPVDGLLFDFDRALSDLVDIIERSGIGNLSRGVELGPMSWAVKANDRLEAARAVLAKAARSDEREAA